MKSWRAKLCVLVLSVAMLPGAFELMENAAHLVTEGHLAHAAADGHRHDPSGPEHGCTPVFHFCGCHASLAFVGAPAVPAAHVRATGFSGWLASDSRSPGFRPSVDRPPQV